MDVRSSVSGSKGAALLGLRVLGIRILSGDIAYVDEGVGRTVLLLHGAPLTSLGFVRVVRALRTRHRVVAPDLPGFGRSCAAPTFDGSLSAYARSIEEFCCALGLENFVLFGFDSSGCTGLSAAAKIRKHENTTVGADLRISLTELVRGRSSH